MTPKLLFALRTAARWRAFATLWLGLMALTLSACGGPETELPLAPPPAAIALQPSDQAVTVGGDATFSVSVSNATSPSYRWQTLAGGNWADIAGATAASLTISGATLAQDGNQYRAVVGVAGTTLISVPVTLSVKPAPQAPAIAVQPSDLRVTEPASARFDVTANGTATLTYQWQRNVAGQWTNIAGATAASHTTPATTRANDNGAQFRVVVANAVGSVTSNVVTLGVDPAPVAPAFTTQPQDVAVTEPAAAGLSVAATGTPAPTLQWQRSTDAGASWSDIAGATGTSYTTPATTTAMNGWRYRAIASNGAGSTNSNAATLTVNAAAAVPAITQQPTLSASVAAGASASLGITATGTPTPTYQWQRQAPGGGGFVNITGATSASYTTPPAVFLDDNGNSDDGAQYRVVVTNSQGSVTSNAATLDVTPVALSGFTQVSGGQLHVLALAADGSVWSWGHNGSGQLGRPGCLQNCVPRPVTGLTGSFTRVLAQGDTSFALRSDGTVWSWGFNGNGQLGRNIAAGTSSGTPGQVLMASNGQPLTGIVGIAMTEGSGGGGAASALAWTAGGVAWKWGQATIEPNMGGFNNNDLLAAAPHVYFNGSTPARSIARAVAGGFGTVLVVDGTGSAAFWSYNFGGSSFGTTGVIGFSTLGFSGSAIDMAISGTRVLLLRGDGTLWGQAYVSNLVGTVNWNNLNQPLVQLALPEAATRVAVGRAGAVSVAVGASGTVYTAGDNPEGQLGSGSVGGSSRLGFAAVPTVNDADLVTATFYAVLVRRATTTLWGWGGNNERVLGTSDSAGRTAGSTAWVAIESTPHPVTGR